MRRAAGALLALLLLAATAGAGAIWWGLRGFDAPGPLVGPREVVVPRGGLGTVAAALTAAGVIDDPLLFRAACLVTRGAGPLRAAEFAFPPAASIRQVLLVLRTARPVQHRFTIPEGVTSAQIATLLGQAEALTGDAPAPAEGSVLPETYAYDRGTTRAAILDRARAAMDRTLAAAWQARDPGLPLAGPRDALILASIVEHETGKPAERPRVAAVFLNRLRLGMKLQSDPTVIYGVTDGLGSLDRKLTRADLDRATAYNTYRVAGLPPGPIDNPGAAAIHAVTQPAATADLYFVADGTGGHAFAQTLDDHLRNVARYRAVQAVNAGLATEPLPAPEPPPAAVAAPPKSAHTAPHRRRH